jgi:PAS domain S-box-containing protein
MSDNTNATVTKETIKQRLNGNDLPCQYYEAILNTTTDMIALTDGNRIFDANVTMVKGCATLGKDIFSPTFTFKSFFEVINKFDYIYDGYQDKRWYESVLEGNKSDYRVGIAKDGVVHAFNLTLTPLKPFEAVYVMTLTDVTSIMGYKAALEEGIKSSMKDREKSQYLLRQYDKAMESSTLVYKCDPNGIITHANRALSEVFLYGYGELLGKHISIFRGPNVTDEEYKALWEKLQAGKTHRGTIENIDKRGGIHYFDFYMVPISDQEGKIVEFLSLRHEITEVMEGKEAAIKALAEKNKFFDQVSHELRTPLNAIINFTDQALESFDEIFLDEESRDLVHMYIERSHKNSQHLLHLINSLLDMAKLRSGKEKYEIVTINVVSLVRDVYESTGALNTKTELEYLIDLPEKEIYISADVLRLRQVLSNLISNALKFTERGYVRLHVKEFGEECRIEIEDTGRGISEEKIDRIFEPFEQVGVHDQGTGLGLGIVNEYAKGMGMRLSVVSSLGVGSSFIIKTPIVENHAGDISWEI